jgi:hypothetical protein
MRNEVFSFSPKNDVHVNKEEGQSPSAHHTIEGRPVRIHKNSTII